MKVGAAEVGDHVRGFEVVALSDDDTSGGAVGTAVLTVGWLR